MSLQNTSSVEVWVASNEFASGSLERYHSFLSSEEQQRVRQFKFDRDRDFYIFCRGTLREILSRYLSIRAEEIEFRFGPQGKPYLNPLSSLHFNSSHSSNLFVCAVNRGAPVGIDLEQVRPLSDMASIASHFFAPAEQRRLASIAEAERIQSFFECWTRKEAILKATGEGISRPLNSFEVDFGPDAPARLQRLDDDLAPQWQMHSFAPRFGYVCALASAVPWHQLRIRDVDRDTSHAPRP